MPTLVHFPASHLPLQHPLFDVLARAYPTIDSWLDKVRQDNRPCYGLMDQDSLIGLAIEKPLDPTTTKLCTFLTLNRGTGSFFLSQVLAAFLEKGITQVFAEARADSPTVLAFFAKHGFSQTPHLEKPNTVVLHRSL
jgi:hypothetical protein